jgi:hypothetical protein
VSFTLSGPTQISFVALSDNGRYIAFKGTHAAVHKVYVYARDDGDGSWTSQATIAHTNATDNFGSNAGFGGTAAHTLVITSSNGNFYVYAREHATWTLRDTIGSAPTPNSLTIAVSGNFAVSEGAIFYAYSYTGSWASTSLNVGGDSFTGGIGFATDAEDRIAVVNGTSARVYLLTGGSWSLEATPKAADSYRVSLDGTGTVLVVGDTTANAEVDVYTRSGGTWTLITTITQGDNEFPNSLDISRSGRFVYISTYVSESAANNVYLYGCSDAGYLTLLTTHADAGGGTGGNAISGSGHVQVSGVYDSGTVYVHTGAGGSTFDVRPARLPMTTAAGADSGVTVPDGVGVFELTTGGTGTFAVTLPTGAAGQILHLYNNSGQNATITGKTVADASGATFAYTTKWRPVF